MNNTSKDESMSTTLSDDEDDEIDEFDDEEESFIWSQDEPILSAETIENPEAIQDKSAPLLCRLCAGQAVNPVYIYSDFGESMKLAQKINTCLSVKIRKTDPFPKQLCLSCVEKINWCENFDTQCVEAEETLEAMLREKRKKVKTVDFTEEISCDEKFCPLCIEGKMQTGYFNELENGSTVEMNLIYDSDVVLDSSDEEKVFDEFNTEKEENLDVNSIKLQCLNSNEKYLKCGACMNLYYTKENLDEHKCKPNIQSTSKPYKCIACNSTFAFEERLNFHMQFHNGAKELFCTLCNLNFTKELKLFYHYKRYHCVEKNVSCLQCGKLMATQQDLRVHVCVDGKIRPHVCEICNKGFSDGYTLKRHIVTHLPEKPYKCSQCSKSFTQKSRLNKHIASHGVVIEKTQIVWKCMQCNEIFDSCNQIDEHNRKNHDEASPGDVCLIEEISTSKIYHCEFCNSFFNETESLNEHQSRHVFEKPYSCKTCLAVFKSYADAVLHWKDHATEFRVAIVYLCEVCGKEMKELSLLYKHKRKRQHITSRKSGIPENEGKKYACEFCARTFDKIEEIHQHGQDQCSKFPCDVCGNLLPSANSLIAHKRRHNGLRPYECNICGKSYTQSSHMWTHKRFHMGVKPYACEYCDQKFTIKPDLADHTRKKHTRERPFKCDVCNKAFLTGSVFYQHRLIHRGDRRYKCHFCEKAFTRTEALNNHIKIHTGEKPHACDVCGRCFRQKGDMRKHRRTQHTIVKEEFQANEHSNLKIEFQIKEEQQSS